VGEASKGGLVRLAAGRATISADGRAIGRKQRTVGLRPSADACRALASEVYLNVEKREICCTDLLGALEVDVVRRTFVLRRSPDESPTVARSCMLLSRIGVLESDGDRAFVTTSYLPLVNAALGALTGDRSVSVLFESERRKEIGDLAEDLALRYERTRLTNLGHPELAALIQHTSLVWQSAGYDILSFRGEGSLPEEEVYIEVKGTEAPEVQFIWSRNEKAVASEKGSQYFVYCYRNVDLEEKTADGPLLIPDPARKVCPPDFIVEAMSEHVRLA